VLPPEHCNTLLPKPKHTPKAKTAKHCASRIPLCFDGDARHHSGNTSTGAAPSYPVTFPFPLATLSSILQGCLEQTTWLPTIIQGACNSLQHNTTSAHAGPSGPCLQLFGTLMCMSPNLVPHTLIASAGAGGMRALKSILGLYTLYLWAGGLGMGPLPPFKSQPICIHRHHFLSQWSWHALRRENKQVRAPIQNMATTARRGQTWEQGRDGEPAHAKGAVATTMQAMYMHWKWTLGGAAHHALCVSANAGTTSVDQQNANQTQWDDNSHGQC